MALGDWVKALRDYFDHMTGAELGQLLGISKSAVSMIERGENKLSYDSIEKIFKEKHIDPRYWFGLCKGPEEADLSREKEEPSYADLVEEIRDLKRYVVPPEADDPVAHDVAINAPLRKIVELIHKEEGGRLNRLFGVVWMFLEQERNKEPPAKGPAHREPGRVAG